MRLKVHGFYFFIGPGSRWNIFDFVLVAFSLQEVILATFFMSNEDNNMSFMRILRLMKLAKILRALRVLKVFRELQTILESFRRCFVALFWSFVMLYFMLYVFALVFLRGVITYLSADGVGHGIRMQLIDSFGGVYESMISLYKAVTGGDDWAVYYDVIAETGDFYAVVFLFFTFFFSFALFNILTGVFVEKAVLAASPDRDELIMEQRLKGLREADEFRLLCTRLDLDNTGTISLDEFKENMQDDMMVSYMASVGLEIHDVELFFHVITDGDKKEEVSIDIFVEGCMAMKGPATALDVQKQIYEMNCVSKRLQTFQAESRARHRLFVERTDLIMKAINHVEAQGGSEHPKEVQDPLLAPRIKL